MGPASTVHEASPLDLPQLSTGSWQALGRVSTCRGAARPSRAPNPLYNTRTPSSLTMVFRQCSVLVYLVGRWEEGGGCGGGKGGDPSTGGHAPCVRHACAHARAGAAWRLFALSPCIFVLSTSKGMVMTEPKAPATMPPPSATYL